jgi:uncharacterized protein (DUF608 family)
MNAQPESWPTLKHYDGEHLRRIKLPLGGIGTGTVSLGGRGNLCDWEVMNTPAKGYTPVLDDQKNLGTYFAISTLCEGARVAKCLEGPIDTEYYEASEGCKAPNSGLPRFRSCRFKAAYPAGVVELQDDEVPLDVELRAINPMIPGDSASSSLPCAILTFHLSNATEKSVEATVSGTVLNPIGCDGREWSPSWGSRIKYKGWAKNRSRVVEKKGVSCLHLVGGEGKEQIEAQGEMSFAMLGGDEVAVVPSWKDRGWGAGIHDFWKAFAGEGKLPDFQEGNDLPQLSSLARKVVVKPGESQQVTCLLTWRFPNRLNWGGNETIGNHYAQRFGSSMDVVDELLKNGDERVARTLAFLRAFCDAPLPEVVKEAALFNSSTLRSQTCFQIPEGYLLGWEGIHDYEGSCQGSCTHVWNYEQTTPYLFADLSRGMREVEFLHSINEVGAMRFRTRLPLVKNRTGNTFLSAADGQMGCIMKVYREWKLSGDDEFLLKLWPSVKKALEFCWIDGGWDANRDGVMEGAQHNTMDVEYFGPNPQMQSWYLGALKAASLMAKHLSTATGEDDNLWATQCEALYQSGREWTDRNLFNGEYYEHRISLTKEVHPHTRRAGPWQEDSTPPWQLGTGCLIDQLVGQYMAHVCGLGYILDPDNVKTTLESIVKYNSKAGFHNHFNHLRNYVLGDESAVLMSTYPRGNQPDLPFPYCNEVMSGFEHCLAAHLLYEGMEEEGLQVIKDIRDRYDGRKRSPFNEAECGHHYARAMAAWAEVLALSGIRYDGRKATLSLKAHEGKMFFAFGSGWGTSSVEERGGKPFVKVEVAEGDLALKTVELDGHGVDFDLSK